MGHQPKACWHTRPPAWRATTRALRRSLRRVPDHLDDVIARLRQRNTPVPRPLRLPTEAEVREAEKLAGTPFHEDFRRYLLKASDVVTGTLEPVTLGRGGHTEFGTVLRAARESGVPDELVPLCEDNGDFFCMTPSGVVTYWSHDGSSEEQWPNLAAWIEEVWLGDA